MSNFDKFDRQKNRQKKKMVEDEHRGSNRRNSKYIEEIYDDEDLDLGEDYYPCYEDENDFEEDGEY
jgi:hypothetical protein